MIAGTLELQMAMNLARLSQDMSQSKTIIGGAMSSIESAVGRAKAALGALGIGLSVGYFANLIKGSIDAMDHLHDLNLTTNITIENLAGLAIAAKQSGADLDSIGASINKLSVNMGKDAEKFKALGVTAKDPLEAFKQLSDIFKAIEDPQLRAALGAAALGKSWAGAAPLLMEGGARIQEMVDKGSKAAGITKEMTDRADELNDKWTLLVGSGGALNSIVGKMLGPLLSLTNQMIAAKEGADGLLSTLGRFFTIGGDDAKKPEEALRRINAQLEKLEDERERLADMNIVKRIFSMDDIAIVNAQIKVLETQKDMLTRLAGAPFPEKVSKVDTDTATKNATAFVKTEGAAVAETESAYKAMHKTLSEMLLTERDRTEVNKLQLALDAMTAKKRADFKPGEEAALKALAAKVDLMKSEKEALEAYVKLQEFNLAQQQEVDDFMAARAKVVGDAIIAASKEIDQMEFETALIGKTNVERETAIALRKMEIDKIDEATQARMKEAIAAKHLAEENKSSQVSMWQSVESAGHAAFLSIFDTSKSVLERIRDMLKTHLLDILYQVTIKKWIVGIVTSTSGAGVAQSAFGATGAGGGLGSLSNLSSLGNLFGGGGLAGSALAYGAIPGLSMGGAQAAMLASQTGIFGGAGLAATAEAAGASAGMAAAGSMFATAIPYIGLAIAAYSLFGGNKGGGPASFTGYTASGTIGRGGITGSAAAHSANSEDSFTYGQSDIAGLLGSTAITNINAAAAGLYGDMTKLGKILDLDTTKLDGFTASFSLAGLTEENKVAGVTAQLATLSDQMATQLMPNIRDFQRANESLTQTFVRLAAASEALSAQRHELEIQLMEATGDALGSLAARRKDELAALDQTLHALQNQIYAAQDLATATTNATAAIGAQMQAASSSMQTAKQAADTYRQIGRALADEITRISGRGISATGGTLRSLFGTAMTGDTTALGALPKAADDFLAASLATSRTALDFARDRSRVIAMLDQARGVAGGMTDWNDQQAALLQSQIDLLQAIKDEIALPSPDAAVLKQQVGLLSTMLAGNDATVSLLQQLVTLSWTREVVAGAAGEAAQQSALDQATASYQAQKSVSDALRDQQLAFVQSQGGSLYSPEDIANGIAQQVYYYLNGTEGTVQSMGSAYSDAFMRTYALYKAIPGHASGLPYVPRDDYLMRAHQGEAVLSRGDASEWRGRAAANDELAIEVRALRKEVAAMRLDTRRTANTVEAVANGQLSFSTEAAA